MNTAYIIILCITKSYALLVPTVTIEQGTLIGYTGTTLQGRQYFAFVGIPYAQAPVGELRFKETQPPQKWDDIFNASRFGPVCIQYNHFLYTSSTPVIGEEDCLTLNIYSPKLPETNSTEAMDVIIFIHGGAFMFGGGAGFGPQLLLDKDVVFITFNYRVGPLGFLSTEDEVVPGNNGLRDQVQMLKWVQQNIAAFGGNHKSVTLTGSSAGGASVHYHILSPSSEGLFHKGFSSSGTALSVWALMEAGREKAFRLGQSVNCTANNTSALVQCLRDKPAYDIVIQSKQFQKWLFNPYSPFAPTIEKWGDKPFLNQDPYKLLQEGKFQHLPWMTSVTSEEGLYPAAEFVASAPLLQELDSKWNEILPSLLDYNFTVSEELKNNVNRDIRQYYLQNKSVSDSIKQVVQMVGDRLFVYSGVEAAKKQADKSLAPVYFYYFSYRGNQSLSSTFTHNQVNYGVSHADDISYFLKMRVESTKTAEGLAMSKEFVSFITSFAKDGRPRLTSTLAFPTMKEGLPNLRFMHIKSFNVCVAEEIKSLGHPDFWLSLPFQEDINLNFKPFSSASNNPPCYFALFIIFFIFLFAY